MPSSVEARKTGKRSIGKAKKVKNVGLKRTKGVCALTSSIFFGSFTENHLQFACH